MRLSDFDYQLAPERIAQHPLAERDASRLLLLQRSAGAWEDHLFREFPEILRGDELIVVNDARVLPARLYGRRRGLAAEASGDRRGESLTSLIEVLLTRQIEPGVWDALVRPGRKIRVGERILFDDRGGPALEAEVLARGDYGARRLRFLGGQDVAAALERIGHVPLPPYIVRGDEPEDRERYQTVFSRRPGAVAAPTAGLHFSPAVLDRIRAREIEIYPLTLYVGPGTFQPVRTVEVERHRMSSEAYEIPEDTAAKINQARASGRAVVAVGTTVVRAIEAAARRAASVSSSGRFAAGVELAPGPGEADLFLYPGTEFLVVDQLLTNFHLPKSTLLLLVCAFAGSDRVLRAYQHAVQAGYRFYSYGDCMLIR
jgi:S-adenosylmethionine:tRNA ribosyltransferase-isomerase